MEMEATPVVCPVCSQVFPLIEIEAHCDLCVESSVKEDVKVESFDEAVEAVQLLSAGRGGHIAEDKVLALLARLRSKYEPPKEEEEKEEEDWVQVEAPHEE